MAELGATAGSIALHFGRKKTRPPTSRSWSGPRRFSKQISRVLSVAPVAGGEGRSFLSALLVLDADLWTGLAREYGLAAEKPDSLSDPRLVKDMLKRIRLALRDFPGYAKIRRATLMLEPWTVDNGLMTPTLKVKRQQVLKHYGDQVERMYSLDG